MRTISSIYQTISNPTQANNKPEVTVKGRQKILSRLLQSYLPSTDVYRHAFDLEQALPIATDSKSPQNGESSSRILENIYVLWRDCSLSGKEDATFAYAAYLLGSGSVGEATKMVNNLVTTAGSGEVRERMEKRWKVIIEGDAVDDEAVSKMEIDGEGDSGEGDGQSSAEDSSSDVEFVVVG